MHLWVETRKAKHQELTSYIIYYIFINNYIIVYNYLSLHFAANAVFLR